MDIWFAQAPAEWSLVGEAWRLVTEVADGLTVTAFFVVLTWAWATGRIVRGADMDRERERADQLEERAWRGEKQSRRGAEIIETTAKAVEEKVE